MSLDDDSGVELRGVVAASLLLKQGMVMWLSSSKERWPSNVAVERKEGVGGLLMLAGQWSPGLTGR